MAHDINARFKYRGICGKSHRLRKREKYGQNLQKTERIARPNYFFVFKGNLAIVRANIPTITAMNRIFEKSSGGIVYRKRDGNIDVLLLERKNGKGEREYVLPKGRMEESETAKDTALREIGEET